MTARDTIHDAVRDALVKDGWSITADPFKIEYGGVRLYADLAADRPLAAERQGREIVVEVKSFLGASPIHDLELALGQYQLYRTLLELMGVRRELFLAVPVTAHSGIFARPAIREVLDRSGVALLVVDPETREVVTWTR